MRNKLFLLALTLFSLGVSAQIINFPDANFKALLLSSSPSNQIAKNLNGNYIAIDANGDGEISVAEAENVNELIIKSAIVNGEPDYNEARIQNYEGINSFDNITSIVLDRTSTPDMDIVIKDLSKLISFSAYFGTYDGQGKISITNTPALESIAVSHIQLLNIDFFHQLKSIYLEDSFSKDYLPEIEKANNLETLTLVNYYNSSYSTDPTAKLDLKNHQHINSVSIKRIGLYSLDLSGSPQLASVSIYDDRYNVSYSGGPAIFGTLNISNCPKMTELSDDYIEAYSNISKLIANNCVNLKKINVKSDYLGTVEVENCPVLESINLVACSGIIMSPSSALKEISVSKYDGATFDATPASNIEILKLDYLVNIRYPYYPYQNYLGSLKNLNIENNLKLKELSLNNQPIANLDISNKTTIEKLSVGIYYNSSYDPQPDFSTDYLRTLNADNCNALKDINLQFQRGLKNASFKNCGLIENFIFNKFSSYSLWNGNIETLNFENCTSLNEIDVPGHQLKELNIKNCTSIKKIDVEHNKLSKIDVTNSKNLVELNCSFNNLESLNIENNPELKSFIASNNPPLTSIFMKNGVSSFGDFGPATVEDVVGNNPNLKYICADDEEIPYLISDVAAMGLTGININSYCSFTPGGNFNTITGTVKIDADNNGCDAGDNPFEYLKLKISDGTNSNSGETFVQKDGKYEFYTQSGNFSITAQAENPALFTITPATFSTSFADNNNNIYTQDICVTANGSQNDAEVVIAPLTNARPGFDASYNLVWRNKGNTVLSGKVVFNYDSNKMVFQSSKLPYSIISAGSLEFDFSNLKPYESRASEIVFKINTPTDTNNPVNMNDVLSFNAQVTPANPDLTPNDNYFSFDHKVVNSMDPNDIVCLQGETIPSTAVGKYLNYVVNFENTGNAEAENVVVKMEIDPAEFEVSTLQLQNASAPVETVINGNQAEFRFKKIKLPTGGHGGILMKMKSKTNLVEGDKVNNQADIYFDYNLPVKTNDYVTTIKNSDNILAAKISYNASAFSQNHYPVNFDAGLSTGDITSYQWEFSGNPSISTSTDISPVVTYSVPGNYSAKLTVFDASNNSSSQTINFNVGNSIANLSTGKDSDNNAIAIDSDEDDWKGFDTNGAQIAAKVRHTYTGWSHADLGTGVGSQWITLNNFDGYFTYKSKEFTIPENAADAKLNLRSLSFVRNWTYLVKVNPDGTETETEITKTAWMSDGFKGWLNSRSPKVENYSLSSGTYYIKVLLYSNNVSVRQSLDVNAVVTCSSGLIYSNKLAKKQPTLEVQETEGSKIKVFPIPVKESVNIISKDKIHSVEVYDSAGRIIHKKIINSEKQATIDINATEGVYYLKIKTEKEIITRKIIKE